MVYFARNSKLPGFMAAKIFKVIFLILFSFLLVPPNLVFADTTDGPLLFSDNFNDGNFNGWTVAAGVWSVNGGNLISNVSGKTNIFSEINTGSSEWDNYRIEIDVNNYSGVDEGIEFRRAGGNAYAFNLRHGTGAYNTPEVKFWKSENGHGALVKSTRSQQLLNNVWYHIKIEVIGENIKLWINNNLVINYTDAGTNLKKGGIGLQSWTGDLGKIYVKFDNVKITSLLSAPPPPTKTPLIFIPGIGGSELKTKDAVSWSKPNGHGGTFTNNYSAGEKVWVNEGEAIKPGDDDYFDILKLKADGITPEADLELTGNLFPGAYQQTLDFFTQNGYILNQDLFIFPYDWRKDLSQTKDLLDQKINAIKTQTGADKVDIVTHSMGGLVARNYIADPTKAGNVRKLITLAPPNLGSVKILKGLLYGDCLSTKDTSPLCIGISPSELKDVFQNLTGAFELAPTQKYYDFYSGSDNQHPVPFKDLRDIDNNNVTGGLNYTQTKELLTNLGHNTQLFTPAESFHNLDNSLDNTNGVQVSVIAGSGIDTLGQIIEKYKIDFAGIKIPQTDGLKINGDDTVPLLSASLKKPGGVYFTKQNHASLPGNGPALNLVKNILKDDPALPSGVSAEAFKLKGELFSVHSPVNIHLYDFLGNHTGPLPDGGFEANIPGSSYDSLGDAKFIFLPDDGIYTVKFEATGQGSFDFKIRDYNEDINTQTTLYQDIPLTPNTKAETVFETGSADPPILQIDRDGDGTKDLQVSPTSILTGSQTSDLTPPITTVKLTGASGSNSWYRSDVAVELTATDDNSGVLKTEYSLDNGQSVQTYTRPFTVSVEGLSKLKFRSVDNAGNGEFPQETGIKIDKTPPEAKIIYNPQLQNINILGTDNLSAVDVSDSGNGLVNLTDEAGNQTQLAVEPKNQNKKDWLELKSLSYNLSPPITFDKTYLEAKDNLDQKIILSGDGKLTANFDPKTNRTKLEIKSDDNKKQVLEKDGLLLIFLTTNKGVLETGY
ncbi:DUF1080 domain-containing protein [Candidatus Daviesbacteria bacterium]|nr:DUF1080 domain-containing protein [Candidatus Daviesbacteria bacterium]